MVNFTLVVKLGRKTWWEEKGRADWEGPCPTHPHPSTPLGQVGQHWWSARLITPGQRKIVFSSERRRRRTEGAMPMEEADRQSCCYCCACLPCHGIHVPAHYLLYVSLPRLTLPFYHTATCGDSNNTMTNYSWAQNAARMPLISALMVNRRRQQKW